MIITRKLSRQGAIVLEGRHRIPQLAQATLDKWALKRIHDLKIVTKAHKYTFPFYDRYQQKRAFRKVFDILKKQLERQIPYITDVHTPFMDIGGTVSETIIFRVGPFRAATEINSLQKYITRINRLVVREQLPFSITGRYTTTFIEDKDTENTPTSRNVNILEIKLSLDRLLIKNGYLLLHYLPEITRAIETLHRKALYVSR
jgi:hypothetical protein